MTAPVPFPALRVGDRVRVVDTGRTGRVTERIVTDAGVWVMVYHAETDEVVARRLGEVRREAERPGAPRACARTHRDARKGGGTWKPTTGRD